MTTIVAWQYRKATKKVWDSCGEYTYNLFKDNPQYEVRRLVMYDCILREGAVSDGNDLSGQRA